MKNKKELNIVNENALFGEISKFKNSFDLLICEINAVNFIDDYQVNIKLNKFIEKEDLFTTYGNLSIYYKITDKNYWGIHKIGIENFEYSSLNNEIIINLNFSRLFKDNCWKKSPHYQNLIDLFLYIKTFQINKTPLKIA